MTLDDLFTTPSVEAARGLIGCHLTLNGVGGVIVETEAYRRDDPASHSFSGPTLRNATMFGPPGRVYVYRSYGIHWCMNIVCGPEPGGGVLLRALEPTEGLEIMRERRGVEPIRMLCSGPGKLGQALAVTRAYEGMPVDAPPFAFALPAHAPEVVVGPRIGITRGADAPWRFGMAGSKFVSRPFPVSRV